MSASSLARNGLDWTEAPLMTGLVGSGPDPAMLSKKPLIAPVNLEPGASLSESEERSCWSPISLMEVTESFLLRAIFFTEDEGYIRGVLSRKDVGSSCKACGQRPQSGGAGREDDHADVVQG